MNISVLGIIKYSGAVGPMLLGGKGQYFSDRPKNFPTNQNFSGRHHSISSPSPPHPPSKILTISDNIDNFPTISGNIDNFPTGLKNRGACLPPPTLAPLPSATWPLIKYKSSYETLTWKFERILLSLKVAMRPDAPYCICLFFLTPDIILLVKGRVLPLSGVNIGLLILMTFVDIYKHGIKNESVVEMIKYLLLYKKTNSTIKSSFNLCGLVEFGGPDPQHPPPHPSGYASAEKRS